MKHEESRERTRLLPADDAADEMAPLLRALPTLPSPVPTARFVCSRGWFQPLWVLWLLLLPFTAYLLQQWLVPALSEGSVLQATPYPYWRGLLSEVQHMLQAGLQLLQEMLG